MRRRITITVFAKNIFIYMRNGLSGGHPTGIIIRFFSTDYANARIFIAYFLSPCRVTQVMTCSDAITYGRADWARARRGCWLAKRLGCHWFGAILLSLFKRTNKVCLSVAGVTKMRTLKEKRYLEQRFWNPQIGKRQDKQSGRVANARHPAAAIYSSALAR